MKLKTQMMTRHDGVRVLCVGVDELFGPDAVSCDPEVMHDLLAAHALMQAMEEFECLDSSMMKRADELMAECGFAQERAE